jgi:hypothetical protein
VLALDALDNPSLPVPIYPTPIEVEGEVSLSLISP